MGYEPQNSPVRHLSEEELEQRIDSEGDATVQQRLVFVRNLYRGDSVETAANVVGVDEATGRAWRERWDERGVDGLRPEYDGPLPSVGDEGIPTLAPGGQATVEYLNYEVLDDYGWDLDDDALFEKAADADLDETDHGTLTVREDESILEAAEAQGYVWPYACRGGACANCVAVCKRGEIEMPVNQILPDEALNERNARLTYIGSPATIEVGIVYNAKQLDYLNELRLPPQQVDTDERGESDGLFSWLF